MDMFDVERTRSFPLTDKAPSSARHWFSDQSQLPVDLRDRIVLLMSELVANSVTHSGLSAPEEVEVSVRRILGGLHIEVVDHGRGILDTRPRPGHFGLRFVDVESDRWGYTNDPTCVWFDIMGDGA